MPDFNPVIFEKRRKTVLIPRDSLRRILEVAVRVKLRVGKREIKRVFKRSEGARVVAAAIVRIIHAAEVLLPRVVPIAHVVGDVGVRRFGRFADIKIGSHD